MIDLDGNTEGKQEFVRQFDGLPLDQLYIKKPHNWAGIIDGNPVIDQYCHRESYSHCSFLWYSLTILWDGHVTPCPQDFFQELIMGDLRTQTIKEIWDGKPLVGLRDSLVKDKNGKRLALVIRATDSGVRKLSAFPKLIFVLSLATT